MRGLVNPEANSVTVNPVGTVSCRPSGCGTTFGGFVAEGVTKGAGNWGFLFSAAKLHASVARMKKIRIVLGTGRVYHDVHKQAVVPVVQSVIWR